eukprot:SAG31_NODE_1990_length_6714_cov_43.804384_4_plen_1151_part_00
MAELQSAPEPMADQSRAPPTDVYSTPVDPPQVSIVDPEQKQVADTIDLSAHIRALVAQVPPPSWRAEGRVPLLTACVQALVDEFSRHKGSKGAFALIKEQVVRGAQDADSSAVAIAIIQLLWCISAQLGENQTPAGKDAPASPTTAITPLALCLLDALKLQFQQQEKQARRSHRDDSTDGTWKDAAAPYDSTDGTWKDAAQRFARAQGKSLLDAIICGNPRATALGPRVVLRLADIFKLCRGRAVFVPRQKRHGSDAPGSGRGRSHVWSVYLHPPAAKSPADSEVASAVEVAKGPTSGGQENSSTHCKQKSATEATLCVSSQQLGRYICRLWRSGSASHLLAIAMMVAFPDAAAAAFSENAGMGSAKLERADVVSALIKARRWRGLEDLLENCSGEGATAWSARKFAIDRLLAGAESGHGTQQLALAERLVGQYDLYNAFPAIGDLSKRQRIRKLLCKHEYQLSTELVGSDKRMQAWLCLELADPFGQHSLAAKLAKNFCLGEQVTSRLEAIAASASIVGEVDDQNAQHHLKLPSTVTSCILFAMDTADIETARRRLLTPQDSGNIDLIIGLDVEWKPQTCRSEKSSPASILQVASRDCVVIFDLLTLLSDAAANANPQASERSELRVAAETLIAELFQSKQILKVGFDFAGDLNKLHDSYPHATCFHRVENIIDGKDLATASRESVGPGKKKYTSGGLSRLTEEVLGKSLDKAEQCSNWEIRPLTASQLRYAALDSWVLVQIADRIAARLLVDLKWKSENSKDNSRNGATTPFEIFLQNACVLTASRGNGKHVSSKIGRHVGKSPTVAGSSKHSVASAVLPDFTDGRLNASTVEAAIFSAGLADVVTVKTVKSRAATSTEAAAALGTTLSRIGKSVVFNCKCKIKSTVESLPVCVVIRGDCMVDKLRLAAVLGVSRQSISIASPAECVSIFGYPPGAMPPFGHREETAKIARTFIDAAVVSVLVEDKVANRGLGGRLAVGAGSISAMCLVSVEDLVKLCGPQTEIADVCRHPIPAEDDENQVSRTSTAVTTLISSDSQDIRNFPTVIRKVAGRSGKSGVILGGCPSSQQLYDAAPGATLTSSADTKFVVGNEMHRLARWLRVIGVDAAHDPSQTHQSILRLAEQEGRVLLTRDRKLASRRDCGACYFVT